MLKYKGYTAHTEVDFEAGIIIGRVLDIRDVLTFEGGTPQEAEQGFHSMVDAYLEQCKAKGREPDRPFSGTFSVRIAPDLHKRISIAAAQQQKSLNQWVSDALERCVDAGSAPPSSGRAATGGKGGAMNGHSNGKANGSAKI